MSATSTVSKRRFAVSRPEHKPHDPAQEWHRDEVLMRWPRVVAHLICHSLGYATPGCAANIIADMKNKKENWCEWIFSCYSKQPKPAIERAIQNRHHHKGYMAEYRTALPMVQADIAGNLPHDMLAAWF